MQVNRCQNRKIEFEQKLTAHLISIHRRLCKPMWFHNYRQSQSPVLNLHPRHGQTYLVSSEWMINLNSVVFFLSPLLLRCNSLEIYNCLNMQSKNSFAQMLLNRPEIVHVKSSSRFPAPGGDDGLVCYQARAPEEDKQDFGHDSRCPMSGSGC